MPWNHFSNWFFDLAWLLFMFVLFLHFFRDRRDLLRTKTWLKTKGHITHYELSSNGGSVWPKIEYTYQVHEKELVGQYLFLDTAHNNPNSRYSRQIAYKAAVAFKENAEIDVYYDPNIPEHSALDVSMPLKLNLILGFVLSLILLQLIVIIRRLLLI